MKKRITEDAVRRLRPGDLLMCDSLTGFGVRKTLELHKVVFFVRKSVRGKNRRAKIGEHPYMSVRTARKVAAAKLLEFVGGAYALAPSPFLRAPSMSRPETPTGPEGQVSSTRPREEPELTAREVLTLGELWSRLRPVWLARVNEKTRTNLITLFDSRILPKWADTPVDHIQTANLSEWYHSFLESTPHYGAAAAKRVIRLLKLGHEYGLVEFLPEFNIRFIRCKRRSPIERDAVGKLVSALETVLLHNPRNSCANAVIAILNTGERARAAAQLHTREVDYKSMCITKIRKNNQVKRIPMSRYTGKFLRSIHPVDGGYYFPSKSPSRPITYSTLRSFFRDLCCEHDIRTRDGSIPTLHCLRHTYATLLEESGLPLSHIQRLLGHSSLKSTMQYVHGSEDAAREGANRLVITRVRLPDR